MHAYRQTEVSGQLDTALCHASKKACTLREIFKIVAKGEGNAVHHHHFHL